MKPSSEQQLTGELSSAARRLDIGDVEHAVEQAGQIVHQHPDHVPARLLLARALLGQDHPAEALDQLNAADQYLRVQSEQPSHPAPPRPPEQPLGPPDDLNSQALMLRAQTLWRLGEPDAARAALSRVLETQPEHVEALRQLAEGALERNDLLVAMDYLNRLLRSSPDNAPGLELLAEACDRAGDAERAIEAIDRLSPGQGPTRRPSLQRARLLRRAGRIAEADAEYRQLTCIHADDHALAHEAATLAVELGDDAAACRWLNRAAAFGEGHAAAAARLDLAHEHMRCGRFPRAARCCWGVVRHDRAHPQAIAALLVCACVEARDRLIDRCGRMLRRAITTAEPRRRIVAQAWSHAVPGMLLNRLIESQPADEQTDPLSALLDEAVETLDEAASTDPGFADRHYHLAVAHAALDHKDAAVVALDRALALNRRYAAAARLRASLLAKEGHDHAARAVLNAADQSLNEAA
ncbi:MAG: tetratricopeptide repeat protein [Alphaproteobacteria bacterium]|jgi:tetratricopeptide (TPR) repeat protein|nr:tetratricopeptide repeat protein [Alphaproteobacteria bacterium]